MKTHLRQVVQNLPARYDPLTWPQRVTEKAREIAGLPTDWLSGRLKAWPGYLIHGPIGVGKTAVALWLGDLAAQANKSVKFTVVNEVVREIKESWGNLATSTEKQAIENFTACDLLIIDDVGGVQFGTVTERNLLYDVVVGRYNRCKPTIMTTNCNLNTPEGRKEFYECAGARIADRFQDDLVDAWNWGKSLRAKKL